jgi:hypothetical protein
VPSLHACHPEFIEGRFAAEPFDAAQGKLFRCTFFNSLTGEEGRDDYWIEYQSKNGGRVICEIKTKLVS